MKIPGFLKLTFWKAVAIVFIASGWRDRATVAMGLGAVTNLRMIFRGALDRISTSWWVSVWRRAIPDRGHRLCLQSRTLSADPPADHPDRVSGVRPGDCRSHDRPGASLGDLGTP